MTSWQINITDEAKKDYYNLENSLRRQVLAGIHTSAGQTNYEYNSHFKKR